MQITRFDDTVASSQSTKIVEEDEDDNDDDNLSGNIYYFLNTVFGQQVSLAVARLHPTFPR